MQAGFDRLRGPGGKLLRDNSVHQHLEVVGIWFQRAGADLTNDFPKDWRIAGKMLLRFLELGTHALNPCNSRTRRAISSFSRLGATLAAGGRSANQKPNLPEDQEQQRHRHDAAHNHERFRMLAPGVALVGTLVVATETISDIAEACRGLSGDRFENHAAMFAQQFRPESSSVDTFVEDRSGRVYVSLGVIDFTEQPIQLRIFRKPKHKLLHDGQCIARQFILLLCCDLPGLVLARLTNKLNWENGVEILVRGPQSLLLLFAKPLSFELQEQSLQAQSPGSLFALQAWDMFGP